jgi:hypothetical protein
MRLQPTDPSETLCLRPTDQTDAIEQIPVSAERCHWSHVGPELDSDNAELLPWVVCSELYQSAFACIGCCTSLEDVAVLHDPRQPQMNLAHLFGHPCLKGGGEAGMDNPMTMEESVPRRSGVYPRNATDPGNNGGETCPPRWMMGPWMDDEAAEEKGQGRSDQINSELSRSAAGQLSEPLRRVRPAWQAF